MASRSEAEAGHLHGVKLRPLGRGVFIPFPEIDRDIRNIKPEGKLALGELQIQPPDLDVVAPRPHKIRVFLPGDRLFCL